MNATLPHKVRVKIGKTTSAKQLLRANGCWVQPFLVVKSPAVKKSQKKTNDTHNRVRTERKGPLVSSVVQTAKNKQTSEKVIFFFCSRNKKGRESLEDMQCRPKLIEVADVREAMRSELYWFPKRKETKVCLDILPISSINGEDVGKCERQQSAKFHSPSKIMRKVSLRGLFKQKVSHNNKNNRTLGPTVSTAGKEVQADPEITPPSLTPHKTDRQTQVFRY